MPSPPKCGLDLSLSLADRFIVGVASIDYDLVILLKPFGFHLAMDTLPSDIAAGRRDITPAFGYQPVVSGCVGLSPTGTVRCPAHILHLSDFP